MRSKRGSYLFLPVLVIILCFARALDAQSSDQRLPTAVRSNEINATIRALDLGDPRLTRHFYAFEGTPGDLIIALESRNLNGDVDIFTAVTFRPLMKISMYAESANAQVTKSIYLRSRQILILRVEARTPNDDPGSYQITFSGSFQPFSGGIPVAENSEANESESRQSNVSSVGATIERPAAPVGEAKPRQTSEDNKETTTTPKPVSTARRTPGRNTRSARNRPTTRRTPPRQTGTAKTQTPGTETAKTEASKPAEGEEKPVSQPAEKPETKPAEPEKRPNASLGAHLIIERSDGNRTDHPMSAVRRVVVESGVIVVTLKNGRIERIPLSMVARMAIEP
jgi:hypothetical protein